MAEPMLWVHDKALTVPNELLANKVSAEKAFFFWDNDYFKHRSYSLKRLVFIYESLCEMPVQIIQGNITDCIKNLAPSEIVTLSTADTVISEITSQLANDLNVTIIKPQPFVAVDEAFECKRFFKYWNKAKKTAFLNDGMG